MKLANSVRCLAVVALALSLGLTGCNKKPVGLTTLGGTGPRAIVDDVPTTPRFPHTTPVRPDVPVTPTPPNDEGWKAAIGDWDNPAKWTPNRDIFREQTVYFDFDKATVKPSEVGKLKEVASRMKTLVGHALKIEGHCDERGTEEYNRTLSDRRAQAIREFLIKEGMDGNMIPTIPYGEDKPADPGHNDAAYAKNRRGELVLLAPVR